MKSKGHILILILYLLGIFMGAIDTGIVSPARELIENSFGAGRSAGTWMITLYTLVYATSMPITSKMADRFGYKRIYLFGIGTFGLGSLLCGIANFTGGFWFFLLARGIQALGGGGIMPIANAEIGSSFPEEKRGTALGLVGMMYGMGNILGPTLGSTILSIAGTANWGWIFFINVPISILIIVLSLRLTNRKPEEQKPVDFAGALVLTGVVGSLLYALTNLDYFNFLESLLSVKVMPFLILFLLLTPVLIFLEKKAEDPILNLKYFSDSQMLTTLIIAFFVGLGMMGMVFVPQFSENILKIKAGTGGYLVTLLAVFSGIAAPLSGRLIDKKGAKFVLLLGFLFNIAGSLVLGYGATYFLNFPSVLAGLALMGLGVGFTMGAPLNYLVLKNVPAKESASGLAAMSLMRSMGLAVSPGLLVGFIVNGARNSQSRLMELFQTEFAASMPKGQSMSAMSFGDGSAFKALENADVTTIVSLLKEAMGKVLPGKIGPVVLKMIDGISDKIVKVFQDTLNTGYQHMYTAAAIIAFLGFAATLFLRERKTREKTDSTL